MIVYFKKFRFNVYSSEMSIFLRIYNLLEYFLKNYYIIKYSRYSVLIINVSDEMMVDDKYEKEDIFKG